MPPDMMNAASGAAAAGAGGGGMGVFGIMMLVLWISIIATFVVGYVMLVIANWRSAKAQRSTAQTLRELAEVLKRK
jgi:hypothetical protein